MVMLRNVLVAGLAFGAVLGAASPAMASSVDPANAALCKGGNFQLWQTPKPDVQQRFANQGECVAFLRGGGILMTSEGSSAQDASGLYQANLEFYALSNAAYLVTSTPLDGSPAQPVQTVTTDADGVGSLIFHDLPGRPTEGGGLNGPAYAYTIELVRSS